MLPPVLDQDPCFQQGVEDLPVEQLVSELPVEGLVVAVLPGASRLNEERLGSHSAKPPTNGASRELGSIVGSNELGHASEDEELGQPAHDVLRVEAAPHVDREALSGGLVDHSQHAVGPSVRGAVHDEVIAPDVIRLLRPQANAGGFIEPEPPALRLLLRDLSPSRRQIRATRLWFTLQPSCSSRAWIRRYP